MKYTVYKTTNNINGKIYIGTHITNNINDCYLGSGTLLKKAISKYGKHNFSKEVLFVYDNPDDMFSKEAELVNSSFLESDETYNLKQGGDGGWSYINTNWQKFNGKRNPKGIVVVKTDDGLYKRVPLDDPRYKSGVFKSPRSGMGRTKGSFLKGFVVIKDSNNIFRKTDISTLCYEKGSTPTYWLGQKHKASSIEKAKTTYEVIKHQQGAKNSQYGTCWVMHLQNKLVCKIDKSDIDLYVGNGWVRGRNMSFPHIPQPLTRLSSNGRTAHFGCANRGSSPFERTTQI